jgi:hypothetical protein
MSVRPQDGLPALVTALGTLGTQGTVHIPHGLVHRAGWPEDQTNVQLIAEWIDRGRIRLHLRSAIESELEEKRQAIVGSDSDEMAAFLDRYREATLRFSNTQVAKHSVQLKREAEGHLGISKTADRDVYLEARKGTIDLLSPDCRSRRLEDFSGSS